MKNNLITTQKTEVVLAKGKSLLGITAKILSGSKALAETPGKELATQGSKDVTIIGDLMWENVVNTEEHRISWYEAMEYAKNLRLCGCDDWRLPTVEELREAVRGCGGISVTYGGDDWVAAASKNSANKTYLENCQAKGFASVGYWSSTTYADNIDYAWLVIFSSGFLQGASAKSNSIYVRCVRARQ